MSRPEFTLIVAATNRMGIGKNGALPWTGLKKEMAYFANVTKKAETETPNAVIMGRKTWDSIPPKFRPLKNRFNIIVTRNASTTSQETVLVQSLDQALQAASKAGRTFVIGGGQIYQAALAMKESRRILLTRILSDFECDTFFPIDLSEDGRADGWRRKSNEELGEWTGEIVPQGVQVEHGIQYIFELWERID